MTTAFRTAETAVSGQGRASDLFNKQTEENTIFPLDAKLSEGSKQN